MFYANNSVPGGGASQIGVPSHRDISIPLYVGGAVAQLSGLAAVAFQLSEPSFAYFTMLLSVVGLVCSYFLRRFGSPRKLIQGGAVAVLLVFVGVIRGIGPFQTMVPFEAQGSQELLLVCALAFTSTFCSFLLITDQAVMFTCVWAIAIIGLTGTVNINQELIGCFIAFLFASSFLLVHQNSLVGGMPAVTERTLLGEEGDLATSRWNLLRTQALVGVACAVTAVLLGFLIAIPLQVVGRNLSLAAVLGRLNVPPAAAQRLLGKSGVQLDFNNSHDFEVGLGPVGDDETERARVQTPRPYYWRGRLFDSYTSRGWSNSFVERSNSGISGESLRSEKKADKAGFYTYVIKPPDYPRGKTTRVKYHWHTDSGSFAPIFVAGEPLQLSIPTGQVLRRPDNTLTSPGPGSGWGSDYDMVCDVPDTKASDLRRTKQGSYPAETRRLYLPAPENADLDALTQQILTEAKADNPYAKAEALRQYVASNDTYTLDAPPVPRGRDAAEYFLRESKQGYCDLYATALCILCRHAGLPARIATGFAPGKEDPDAKSDGKNKTFILRESDRHAWVEVYFTGYGWLVFDATVDTPGTVPAAQTPEPKADDRTLLERILGAGLIPLLLTGAGLLGTLYFLFVETSSALRGQSFLPQIAKGNTGSASAKEIARVYTDAARRLARRGVRRASHMTTTEYLGVVRERLGDGAGDAFAPLTALFQRAVYGAGGTSPITGSDARAARDALKSLETALKETKRALR